VRVFALNGIDSVPGFDLYPLCGSSNCSRNRTGRRLHENITPSAIYQIPRAQVAGRRMVSRVVAALDTITTALDILSFVLIDNLDPPHPRGTRVAVLVSLRVIMLRLLRLDVRASFVCAARLRMMWCM